MERKITESLKKWKHSSGRQPLLINGTRQVGKTHLLIHFGQNHYKNHVDFKAEVDFVIQSPGGQIIPLEVKSSEHVKAKSLAQYIKHYSPERAYRISTKNFGKDNRLFSVPLYACFCI